MTLNVKAFALTCGIIWGFGVLLFAWWPMWVGSANEFSSSTLKFIYVGFNYTYLGGIIGLVWGFCDGLIGGALFAWLYNKLVGKFS